MGQKYYAVERGLAKMTVTAIFAFYASGTMCPPMLIYRYKRIPSEITHRVPDDFSTIKTYKMFEGIVESQLITELNV
jgi:hypothetical protein